MTLRLKNYVNGPHVICDQCQTSINLPHNCAWGQKFIKPSLAKLGMTVKGPHVCKDCKASKAAYHGDIDGDLEGYDGA